MANIKPWLEAHNFKEVIKDKQYELEINNQAINVDIENESIKYPELIKIGRKTTTNFSAEENFVVLDVVIGLLKQGYLPNHIWIEKGYKLGHNTKSGNADITVEDNEGNTFIIIEAKTFGAEFDKEWKNTLNDGGQLFSYERQENKAEALVLYASRVNGTSVERIYHAIHLKDNDEFLATLDNPESYKKAKGGDDKFKIWRDVYQQEFRKNGVLEPSIKSFVIGKNKSSVSDLKEITHDEVQKKYNEFATILRKHNVGGRENAFDKLVNLFLAKIVDEEQNKEDLMFDWKGVAQDTYFDLVDRLQKLYQVGMEKFLDEKVSYVAEKDIEDAFRLRKDAAKDAIFKYFKELKYFSNNDFTFLDVYNEQLFYQNSRILVEVVQMLQDMKLKTKEQNQFLGDLFEGFLDNGVKQSEGQFFTPLPIVKFIVSSLPIEQVNQSTNIPKVIDFASGAGHFLNEYAEQIKDYVEESKLPEYYSEIYGIEKEYRLSKVAKVSAFMYGQDDINIIYGDALDEHNQIRDNSFSVVIANPPYSVKGFLETLSIKQREKYELSLYVDRLDTNNSIELFFIERAKQLLKSEGVAGIIVPSSVLSNGKLYTRARKILIENFDIIGIAEFGSKTFGSTGTNTITLFLRKKKYPPNEADNYRYAVERWFTNTNVEADDITIIKNYCKKIEIDYSLYRHLQKESIDKEILLQDELFKEYVEVFKESKQFKKIRRRKITQKYSEENKIIDLDKALLKFIKEKEEEKVFYFAIANAQNNDVVIVQTPNDKDEKKKFLGYEWSKRKGQEGIKYIGTNITDEDMEVAKNQAINNIQTPLFNPINVDDESKINTIIRNNFNNKELIISEELEQFVSIVSLVDLLDFTQIDFDAQIKTSPDSKIEITSKYTVNILKSVADIKKGQTITKAQAIEGDIKVVAGGKDYAYTHNEANRTENIITISASGANAGFVNYWSEPIFASDTITVQANSENETKYVFNYLKALQEDIFSLAKGAAQPHVYAKDIEKIPIPVPPIKIQKKINDEVETLKERYLASRMEEEEFQNRIMHIFIENEVICNRDA